jgi:hypothetical protein
VIPLNLVDELVIFLTDGFKNYKLPTNKKTVKPPQIVGGFLPHKNSPIAVEPDFPHIIVRLMKGQDVLQVGNKGGQSQAHIRIIFGTYSEDHRGWREIANIIEHTRQILLKKRTIGRKFCLKDEVKWDIPDDQPYPEWVGTMETIWLIAQPQEEVLNYEGIFTEK